MPDRVISSLRTTISRRRLPNSWQTRTTIWSRPTTATGAGSPLSSGADTEEALKGDDKAEAKARNADARVWFTRFGASQAQSGASDRLRPVRDPVLPGRLRLPGGDSLPLGGQRLLPKIRAAGNALRTDGLPRFLAAVVHGDRCDLAGLCRQRTTTSVSQEITN